MTWQIDAVHSTIEFTVRHLMISNARGRFERFEGTVEFDEEQPQRSRVEVQIDVDSLNTKEPQRDGHLKSPDFLDAEKYPYITFKSSRVEKTGSDRGRIIGDLTIREVTREVVLDVEYSGQAKSPWGTVSAGFSATTKLNRKDWGMTWNQLLETGGLLVGDEAKINVELELVKQTVEAAKS